MSSQPLLEIIIPSEFTQAHHDALIAYLTDSRNLSTAVWEQLYQGIDLLGKAQVVTSDSRRSFRQIYDQLIGQPFANQYIEQLLDTNDVSKESPRITALFASQIRPILQETGLWRRDVTYSVLLYGYSLYWWQSFARGYAFEVQIMRDLMASEIQFQMHDLRDGQARFSPADLIILDLFGDIKTSIYFLQQDTELQNDFLCDTSI